MKYILYILILIYNIGFCQENKTIILDSLQKQYTHAKTDSLKASLLLEIIYNTGEDNLGNLNNGQFAKVYEAYRTRLDMYESPENQQLIERVGKKSEIYERFWGSFTNDIFNYGVLMGATANKEEQLLYYKKAYELAKRRNDTFHQTTSQSNIAYVYQHLNMLDSALFYVDRIFAKPVKQDGYYFYVFYLTGDVKLAAGKYEQAKKLFYRGVENTEIFKDITPEIGKAINYLGLSKVFRYLNNRDSSYYYGVKSLTLLKELKEINVVKIDLASAYENMYAHFQKFQKSDSAYKYLILAHKERTRLTNKTISNLAAFQQSLLKKQLALKDLEREKIETQSRTRTYILIAILLVFILFGAVLLYYYLQKKKANIILALQKEEIQSTLTQLRFTQSQLIQSEKMASLGELTAGIAHEIQNPLNFVNNFSEVTNELIDEMKDEFKKGDLDEGFAIADDIKQNLDKINHHGKRADAIVKGMLQHSRSSSGAKEPTDINALTDEYLRLAYHGQRAKDKSFNATLKTDFDESIDKIDIIPQDIGRVILNLITNAFYAVNERKQQQPEGYEPTVSVTTRKTNSKVELLVSDNGPGIPQHIVDKIFQPFFTTKPTGSGTGLGLSLSYDIVKTHGGDLKVETKEGEGTDFIIQLPL